MRVIIFVLMCLFTMHGFALSKGYVSARKDNAVSVIDLASNQVIASITGLSAPDGLTISPDGTFVYVANSGASTLSVIDTSTDKIVANLELGNDPESVVMARDGKLMLAALQDDNALFYVDPMNNTVVHKMTVLSIYEIALNGANTTAIVGSQEPGKASLKFLDIANKMIKRTVLLNNAPIGLQFGPSDHYFYYTAAGIDAVLVFDPLKYQIVKLIPTAPGSRMIRFTHNGKWGLVTNQGMGLLYVFDPENHVIVDKILVGKGANGLAVSGDDKFAYVANEGADSVTVVDLLNKKVVATVAVGKGPRKIVLKEEGASVVTPSQTTTEIPVQIPGQKT